MAAGLTLTRRFVDTDPACLSQGAWGSQVWCLEAPSYAQALRWTSGGAAIANLLVAVPAIVTPPNDFVSERAKELHVAISLLWVFSPFVVWPASAAVAGHKDAAVGMLNTALGTVEGGVVLSIALGCCFTLAAGLAYCVTRKQT